MTGPYRLELVIDKDSKETQEKSVIVSVTDPAGSKVARDGARGMATVLTSKGKASIPPGCPMTTTV